MPPDPKPAGIEEPDSESDDLLSAAQTRSARDIRNARWMTFGVVSALVVLTCYAFLLNAFVLVRSSPRPYRLQVLHSTPAAELDYRVEVEWASPGGVAAGQDVVRPTVLLDGVPVALAPGGQGAVAVHRVQMDAPNELRFVIPPGATPGVHTGMLRLVKVRGSEGTPEILSAPLSVSVNGNLWTNWFFLRDWLIVLGLVYLAAYLLFALTMPRPRGSLVLDSFQASVVPAGIESGGRSARLRMRRLAWFFPWLRSGVALEPLLRKMGVLAPRPEGRIWFVDKALVPLLLTVPGLPPALKCRARKAGPPKQSSEIHTAGIAEFMHESRQFGFHSGPEGWVFFRYSEDR
jgi:hypothetical protein